jgi:hypothetical protein
MRKGTIIFTAFVILVFFINICIADTNDTKVAVKAPQLGLMGAASSVSSESSLLSSWQSPTTCSMIWGGNCSEGPPESFKNTYDNCSTGAGGDESINEVYLNTSSLLIGQSITVTCNVMIWGIMRQGYGCNYGWQGDGLNIYYRNNSTAAWQRKYQVSQVYSCNNYSVSFVPDSVEGVQQARCIIGYRLNPNAECGGGSYFDNDDVNFSVYSQFISITLSSGVPIDFGSSANPGSNVNATNNPLIISVDTIPPNVNFDITTRANSTDFISSTNNFPVSNMKWALTPSSSPVSYSTSDATVYSNRTAGNFTMYHQLSVPAGQQPGTYNAEVVITAKSTS